MIMNMTAKSSWKSRYAPYSTYGIAVSAFGMNHRKNAAKKISQMDRPRQWRAINPAIFSMMNMPELPFFAQSPTGPDARRQGGVRLAHSRGRDTAAVAQV